ncbi:MAG: discoidin domain-containing protein [Myxococcota bacterium]|nr:discoidin domain-containing protein [Myxococcota bacterium]
MSVLLSSLLVTSSAFAGVIKPTLVEASSTLPATAGVSYSPKQITDAKQSTVWVEGEKDSSGVGTTVTMTLAGAQTVSALRVWNGNWYSHDFWQRHNRVKDLEVTFSDGTKEVFTLTDEKLPETITFKKPISTESVRLRIKSNYRGSTINDTVISEVQWLDGKPDAALTVTNWKDSTHLPEDGDGSYEPPNMWDGVLDSMWCESAEGDGTGEWIEFEFGGTQTISSLRLVNGNAYDLMWWMKSNRVTQAELAFSDGSKQSVEVKNSIREQVISLSPVRTKSVRLTVTGVKQGKEALNDPAYDCVCISEAAFMP